MMWVYIKLIEVQNSCAVMNNLSVVIAQSRSCAGEEKVYGKETVCVDLFE